MTEEKFECVFNQYRNLVMKAAYEILKDHYLAQDVCQEVFFKLSFERLDKLETEDDIKRYLNSVTCHRAIDYYRKLHRMNEVYLEDERDIPVYLDIDEKLTNDEFMGEIFRRLEKKNSKWYEIVRRVGFYDEEPMIVARDMGISIGNLRIMYHRAKVWIRKNFTYEYKYLNDLF